MTLPAVQLNNHRYFFSILTFAYLNKIKANVVFSKGDELLIFEAFVIEDFHFTVSEINVQSYSASRGHTCYTTTESILRGAPYLECSLMLKSTTSDTEDYSLTSLFTRIGKRIAASSKEHKKQIMKFYSDALNACVELPEYLYLDSDE